MIASAGVAVGLAVREVCPTLPVVFTVLLLKPFVVGDYIIRDNHGDGKGTVKREIQLFLYQIINGR